MTRLAVAHIRDSGGLFGAEQVILTLGRNFDRRFRLLLICLRAEDGRSDPLTEQAARAGYEVLQVNVSGMLDLAAISRIRKILLEHDVKIVHAHDYKSCLYGLVASRRLGIRRVTTAHGTTRESRWKRWCLFVTERFVYRFYDAIIAVSEEIRAHLESVRTGKGRIRVIENGIDPKGSGLGAGGTDPPPPFPVPAGRRTFAVIGRLVPDKGHRFFLEAFARIVRTHPDAAAAVIGEGPSREDIEARVRELGLERDVFLTGVRTDMQNVYDKIDFLVIPSLTEGVPYVLLEAMICGVPVLATEVGGIPKLLENGASGCLVPPGDVDALEEAMDRMLADPEPLKEMAANAYRAVSRRYSAGEMARRVEGLYDALAAQ